MQTRRLQSFLSAIVLGLGVLLLFFALLGAVPIALARDNQGNSHTAASLYIPPAQAGSGIIRVAITGTDSSGCGSQALPCSTLQYAVDQALSGEEIHIAAGSYTGVQVRAGVTQTVYISKSLTLRGGYTVTNWATPNAHTNLTVLDALDGGRVIYATGAIDVAIENLGITGGDATGLGGGVSIEDAGGGIYSSGPTLVMTNNHIYSNTASAGVMGGNGGGVYLNGGQATFISNTIKFNQASAVGTASGAGSGGGVYIFGSPATFTNNKIITNTAGTLGDGYGGGIWAGADGTLNLTLAGNLIMDNVAGGNGMYYSSGGGVSLSTGGPGTVNLTENIIQGNVANLGSGTGAGGGLHILGFSVQMSKNQILSNTAAVSSSSVGGGIYLEFSSLAMAQDLVRHNAAGHGGGLYQQFGGFSQFSGVMTNVVFADNTISAGGGQRGAGMYLNYAALTGKHLTLARNHGGDGSGIYITGSGINFESTLNLTNAIIVSHTAGVMIESSAGEVNQAELDGVLWFGNINNVAMAGTNSLNTANATTGNPVFDADGYHISSAGAAFDAGINGGIFTDLDGEIRPQANAPDLGADEVTGPDLEITKSVFPLSIDARHAVTYTVIFTNSGGVTATNVVITDTAPVPTVTVGLISTAGVPVTSTRSGPVIYAWDAGEVPPGQGATLTIPVQISGAAGGIFTFTNSVVITGASSDVNPFNNSDTAPVLAVTPVTFTVTITGDTADANPSDNSCADSSRMCSLRAAIQEANALPGITATIVFSIPGAGPHTISPGTGLPTISQSIIIDGLTQPGALCVTWPPTLNIEIDGSSAAGASGLVLAGGNSVVRGLVVNRFDSNGIHLLSGGNNWLECNFVGTDPSGTLNRGNSGDGIRIDSGSSNNVVGGSSTLARNLVSGNDTGGVYIGGSTATSNWVQGNYIGTNVSATAALSNGLDGVRIEGAPDNTIGGTSASEGNLIAGNGENGIFIDGAGSAGNRISGNTIGQTAAPNGENGVLIINSGGTTIGGDANTIAHNNADGVQIITGTGNLILTNAIHSNAALGIDLDGDGVTPNDAGDADTGGNTLQNFPMITAAANNGATVALSGTLNSTPDTLFDVQFFANATCDASNFGQGEIPIGTDTVLTDGLGDGAFASVFTLPVAVGYGFTAIATDPAGNSSEFSVCTVTGISGPNTFDDDNSSNGNCSLREAILAANHNMPVDACPAGNPGPDVISLGSGTYHLSIAGANEDAGIVGDLDISEALTITGVSSSATIIDAGLLGDRVFHIIAGPANFSNLTILGGQVDGDGGGIYSADTLALENSAVISNQATGSGRGGGLFADGMGFVTVAHSTVANNQATGGGGIANEGSLAVISSTLAANQAITGGGVLLNQGVATLNGASVISNVALNGGGIFNNGVLTLMDNDILQNQAGDSGGGIFNHSGAGGITGILNTISHNRATLNGGGIANSASGNMTLANTAVFSNQAIFSDGGGIYNDGGGSITLLNDDRILGNRAGGDGGGIFSTDINSAVSVTDAEIRNNSGQFSGGGLYVGDGLFTLSGGQVVSNIAAKGGGLFVYTTTAVFSQTGGSLIAHNTAITNGGGVYIFNGKFEMDDAQITQNSVQGAGTDGGGGGIYLNDGQATLRGGEIRGNIARVGGGIAVISPGAALTQSGTVTIAGNFAISNAGGLGIWGGTAALNGARILGNRAIGGSGGALWQQGGTASINNGCIVGNSDVGVVYSGGTSPVDATGNWWGLADGPAGSGPGGGDSVTANVDYSGFSGTAPGGCGRVELPNLFITKTVAAPFFAQPGDPITYTLTFGNNGSGVARNVTLTDIIPASYLTGVSYSSDSNTSVSPTPGITYSWNVGDLDAGEGGAITVTALVSAGTPSGVTVVNSATIQSRSSIADPDPADNTGVDRFVTGLPEIMLILPRDGLKVAEGGASDSYGVRLARPPTDTVQIDIATGGQTSVLPSSLTFSASNWSTAQTVDLFAVDDTAPEYFHTGHISHTATSADGGYQGLAVTATATITDDDVAADLGVQKIAPSVVSLGSTVSYAILVTNYGPWPATNLLITDTLPGADFVGLGANNAPALDYSVQFYPPAAATGGQGELSAAAVICNSSGNIFSCTVDDLIPTGIMVLNLELTPATGSTELVNTVEATADEFDPGLYPNTDTVTTTVAAAAVDMVMDKQASTGAIVAGQPFTYTLTVANHGSDTAYGVTVVDPLPADFVLNGPVVSTRGTCSASDGTINCGLGTMTGLDAAQITFSVVPNFTGNVSSVITNSATVAVGIGSDADSSNNSDSVAVSIAPHSVDLSVSKQASSELVLVGSTLIYTLTVANASTADPAPAVILTDTLPSEVVFAQAIPDSGSCSETGGIVSCSLGTIAPGGRRQVVLRATPAAVGVVTNSVTVAPGFGVDLNPLDNSASTAVTVGGIGEVVSPTASTLLTYPDPQGNNTAITVPAGAVTETIRLVFSPVSASSGLPAGSAFAGHAFRLEAYTHPGNSLLPRYVFSRPLTITINYSDADVSHIAAENELMLYLLNGLTWMDAARTCLPVSTYRRDVAGNRISVEVCHLTEFALFGPSTQPPVYLPLVVKDQ